MQRGAENFPAHLMQALTVVSFTLAGKIEESEQPCFDNVTFFLDDAFKPPRKQLMDLQDILLMTFGFDFNIPNALPFIDWYLNVIENTVDFKI